MVNGTLIST